MRVILPLIALLSTTPAMAQEENRCAPYPDVEAMLAKEYQEARTAQGIGGEGKHMMVIFAAPNGATWTAVLLSPDGTACLVDAGTDWVFQSDAPAVPEQGS
jgi:hypothetical protein